MELTSDHGYVFLAVSYAVILNFWLSSNVLKARKQYKVEYPAIYHKDPMHIFNCYQVYSNFIHVMLTLLVFSVRIKIHWSIFHLSWFNSWSWPWSTQNGPQFASPFGLRPGFFIFLSTTMLPLFQIFLRYWILLGRSFKTHAWRFRIHWLFWHVLLQRLHWLFFDFRLKNSIKNPNLTKFQSLWHSADSFTSLINCSLKILLIFTFKIRKT